MEYDKELSSTARQVLEQATVQADRRGVAEVLPEHLFLSILSIKGSMGLEILRELGLEPEALRARAEQRLPPAGTPAGADPPLSAEARSVLNYARKEAQLLGHPHISALHLLMGLLYDGKGLAFDLLGESDLSLYDLREQAMKQPREQKAREQKVRATQPGQWSVPRSSHARAGFRPSPIFLIPLGFMILSGALLYLNPSQGSVRLLTLVFVIGGWVTAVCLHEFGHALVAYYGGDTSVREKGYLTLNPLKYTHPVLSIVLPTIFVLLGGIPLPGGAVYIDTYALRGRWWRSAVSAAGPLFTLIFGILLMLPFYFGIESLSTRENFYFWPALSFLAYLQLFAFLFNLIPVPGLDGFGILAPWLNEDLQMRAYRMAPMLMILLFVMMFQDNPIRDAFHQSLTDFAGNFPLPLWLVGEGYAQFRLE